MDEERYTITPKGIACMAMLQSGLVNSTNDPRIDGFWIIFEEGMKQHGYIVDSEGDDDE